MNWSIKKTISCFVISAFLLNIALPVREAFCMTGPWWSGSQAAGTAGVSSSPPGEGSQNYNRNQGKTAEPVFVHNGDFVYQNQDILIPSRGINTEITRIYKSQSRYNNRFGFGWDIFYNKKIIPLCNGDLFYLDGELNRYKFSYVDGTNYISPQGIYDKLTQNQDGTFTVTEKYGTVYKFDQNGVLTEIRDRNANRLQFSYDQNGKQPIIGKSVFSNELDPKVIAYDYKLINVTDTVGRQINLNYNNEGKLATITDFAGRAYVYNYDSSGNGDLISFTTPETLEFPSGNTTTYAYQEHNLISITDTKGQIYLTNHYDSKDRVDSQTYGSGTFTFSYDEANKKTRVTNPKGFVTEYIYDDNGSVLSKKELTSGLRQNEPAFYATTYTYNSNLETTQITFPKGNGIKYTYDDGNTDFQKRGNLLEIRRQPQNIALGKSTTASAEFSSQFSASNIVDGTTIENTQSGYWLLPNYTPGWIEVDLGEVYDVSSIKWLNTHNNGYNDRATSNWHIEVSIDGTGYTNVASGSESFTSSPTWVERDFTPTSMRYIRFYVDNYYTYGGGINELEVYKNSEEDIVTAFSYEPQFNFIKTITDPKGNVTTFNYDTKGNLTSIVYPQVGGQIPQTALSYDQYGQLTEAIDPNANKTAYEYYPDTGYLKAVTQDPSGLNARSEFSYDSVGNVTSVKDANANTTTFSYNALNWLTQALDPYGFRTKYAYDANANLTKLEREIRNQNGTSWQTTNYAYTILDQLETITDPLNHTTNFSYDLNANRQSITDANNKTTNYVYDERDLIWKTTDALNNTTEYSYDLNANLSEIKDAKANATTYLYDNFDRLQKATYADASFSQYSYDKNSNLSELRTPNSELINYTYDALNRLNAKNYPATPDIDVTYAYDIGSRLTSIQNPASSIDYQYDNLNRIQSSGQTLSAIRYTLAYEYDKSGNRTRVVYPSGKDVHYSYDKKNRLTKVSDGSKDLAVYTYDSLDRRIQKDLIGSKTLRSDYAYDLANQLLNLNNSIAQKKGGKPPPNIEEMSLLEEGYPAIRKSGTRLSGNQAIRDNVPDTRITQSPSPGLPDNQITRLWSIVYGLWSEKDAQAQSLPLLNSQYAYTYDPVGNRLNMVAPNGIHNYTYNNIYELTAVTGAQNHSFAYDNVGNRQTTDGTNYSANNLNQYSVVGAQAYTYDGNGNLTSDGASTFTYDAENRLTVSTHQPYTTYEYDGFGRRIQKNNDNERIFYYIYDGDRIIEERYDNGDLAASYVYGEGIDEVLTMNRGAQTYYYFYDGLGSVTDLTDSTGSTVETYSYDVYGLPNQTSQIGNRFMFTGREYDEESGLYYYRSRMYSPAIGRFLQRDAIGYVDSNNLYQYSFNSPNNYIDPYGLWGIQFGNFNIGYGNPTFLFNQGSGEYFQQSLYATANGFIPFVDPFQGKYSKCDKGLQWSEKLGALSRDLLLTAIGIKGIPLMKASIAASSSLARSTANSLSSEFLKFIVRHTSYDFRVRILPIIIARLMELYAQKLPPKPVFWTAPQTFIETMIK